MKKFFTILICIVLVSCVQTNISDNNKPAAGFSVAKTADRAASVITANYSFAI